MLFSQLLIVHGNDAKKKLNTKKCCKVIPHGDYSFFLEYDSMKLSEEDSILFFGRIEDYKGLDYLIKSMFIVSKKFPDIKLIIAGVGDIKKYENMILDNRNFEIHNRYIQDEEVPSFFQRAKIVVLPYIEGTQTGIIPIAYAFKKPVVVTNVGSIPEVVDNGITGFIVPPRDEKSLADAILKLLVNEKLRKKMGMNAFIKMNEKLSWDKIADETKKAYATIIRE
jgi:glycosyltransferase involved in cell wall biosynthesis